MELVHFQVASSFAASATLEVSQLRTKELNLPLNPPPKVRDHPYYILKKIIIFNPGIRTRHLISAARRAVIRLARPAMKTDGPNLCFNLVEFIHY